VGSGPYAQSRDVLGESLVAGSFPFLASGLVRLLMQGRRPRPSTSMRGYGSHHQLVRRELTALVASGMATCARCGKPIKPDEPWDLDHDDIDRRIYIGASHASCNRGAPHRRVTSREW